MSPAEVRGLEHLMFEETLREVSFFTLEKTKEGSDCCLELPRWRFKRRQTHKLLTEAQEETRSSSHRLQQGKI